tara:strand:- start:1342 stop:1836 length:495 start_codon:yes stop_codon:yes gene_type:complete
MSSLNKVILIGNLGAAPEMRRTNDGKPIANLSIATSESWKDKNTGEKRERTEWHRVVCFVEGLCGIIEKYLEKGSKVYIEGQLQTRKWQDQEGNDRYSTEIVMQGFNCQLVLLGDAGGSGGARQDKSSGKPLHDPEERFGRGGRSEPQQAAVDDLEDDLEDLPF